MRPLVLMAVLALLVAPAAHAAPPEGFRSSGPLTVRAAKLGAPDSRVYCARDFAAWSTYAASTGAHPATPGITTFATHEVHLAPAPCRVLEGWLRGKKRTVRTLAFQVFVFTHETRHTVGVRDEWAANCQAHDRFARAARLFGIRDANRLAAMKRSLRGRTACYH